MEIWDWSVGKSADELTNYPAYALRIRRTGAASRPALHMLQAPRCAVPVIACTGDLKDGRIIRRGEPAVMACHWPGIYFNGTEAGFRNFQEVVLRLHAGFDNPVWKKNGESARYWAAKELMAGSRAGNKLRALAARRKSEHSAGRAERLVERKKRNLDPRWGNEYGGLLRSSQRLFPAGMVVAAQQFPVLPNKQIPPLQSARHPTPKHRQARQRQLRRSLFRPQWY